MKKTNFLLTVVAGVATIFGAGVAAAQQDVYISDTTANQITILGPGGTVTQVGSNPYLDAPTGLAVSPVSGDLFIANGNGSIEEYNPSDPTPSTQFTTFYASGLANPQGMAFDSNGDLYVANGDVITEFSAASVASGTGIGTTYATLTSSGDGIAINSLGYLYVTLGSSNQIALIGPGGGTIQYFDTTTVGLNDPLGAAIDGSGDLYVVNNANGGVSSIEFVHSGLQGSTVDISGGLNGSIDLGFVSDPSGDFYVTDFGNNTVTEYNEAGQLINTFPDSDFGNEGDGGPSWLAFSPVLAVPEPGTYALLLGGLGALYFFQRRRAALAKV